MPNAPRQTPNLAPENCNGVVRLHIGCGKRNIPGFINVDILEFPHVHHNTGADDLSFAAGNSVDMIYACHVLEHFGRTEYKFVLQEWRRVLKIGGLLRLSVPDFRSCANIYYEKGLEDGLSGLIGLISGGQRDQYDFHKMIFDEPFLTTALEDVGFGAIRHWDWRDTDHVDFDDFSQAHLPHMDKDNGLLMSLNLEALKQ
jgi:predicted SAM-dependent methyltransferase